MKAVLMTGYNRPLEVRDVEDYGDLAVGEAVVKIEMTGVCYRDILTVEGHFPKAKPPLILGHEIAGRITALGGDSKEFREGDRVVSLTYIACGECTYCRRGQENICRKRLWFGEDLNGSYAEYVKTHIRSLVKVPDNIPAEGAAIAACVTGMVLHSLKRVGGAGAGDSALVTGAGGGVGIHAVQILKALGARVIALTTSPEKAETIYSYGADDVIIAGEKAYEQVRALTGGEGVDLVVETVGEPTFQLSLRSVKWGGRIAVIGNVTAASVNIPLGLLILRENKVSGSISSTKEDVKEALDMTASGRLKPVGRVFPLEKAQEAHEAVKRRKILGRAFLKP
ncbi:MAG TPA: alcohol dehydrogenase [Candidatus Caldiarchaeum subterraneum]|uniref:Alcohol dehydrogenase n=1 Tax=Caldiarchaeum subterraneum TaxID=311458 RepID=A0A833EB96_CALS0|nr:alcohol dehydrogenase [Candidatus Caldarchaeum subterraneum]